MVSTWVGDRLGIPGAVGIKKNKSVSMHPTFFFAFMISVDDIIALSKVGMLEAWKSSFTTLPFPLSFLIKHEADFPPKYFKPPLFLPPYYNHTVQVPIISFEVSYLTVLPSRTSSLWPCQCSCFKSLSGFPCPSWHFPNVCPE